MKNIKTVYLSFIILGLFGIQSTLEAYVSSANGFIFTAPAEIISQTRKPKAVMSKQTITAKQVEVLTSRTMFADISDGIKLLPGVVSGGEFDANMYIRGGGPDELLYVVDDHALGNGGQQGGATAFGGRLTRINSKLVDHLTFYSGGFPARYGNVLSGVLDVTYKTGSVTKTEFDLDQNLTEMNWMGQGPIEYDKSSWLVGYRRTYYDLVANLFFPAGTQVPYLTSFYGKYFNKLTPDQNLIFSVDSTTDGAHLSEKAFKNFANTTGQLIYDDHSLDTQLWLESTWSPDSKTKCGIGYSQIDIQADIAASGASNSNRVHQKRFSLGSEWMYTGIPSHNITSGLYYFNQQLSLYQNTTLPPGYNFDQTVTQNILVNYGPVYPNYYGLYTQDEWQILPQFAVNIGLRHERVSSLTQGSVLQPRFSAYIGDRAKTSWVLSVGRFTDFDFRLFDNKLTDLAPRQAIHYVVGVEHHATDWVGRVETYYKDYSQMTYATKNAQTGELAGFTNEGRGNAYGIEFYLQKQETSQIPGSWNGWISYTLSRVKSWDPVHSWFSPEQDVTHVVNLTGAYYLDSKLKVLSTFSFSTGRAYTDVVGRQFDSNSNQYLPIWGAYQGARLPVYSRLDVWVEFLEPGYPFKWWFKEGKTYFGVANVLNYKNIKGYSWNNDYSEKTPVTDFNSGTLLIFGTQIKF